jgi:dipeptidyl aminopeptidase/acylaminoacyl peptidase
MELTKSYAAPLFADESAIMLKPRTLRRFKFWLVSSFVLFLVASSVVSFYAYIAWTLERPAIAPILSNPMKAAGLAYEDIEFRSADGAGNVHGWYIPANSKITIVLSHGYGTTREEPWVPVYELAHELHRNHYNVVMFDYGFVNRRAVTGGILETQELLGAVQYAKERGSNQTYIWGFSMGAGTALQAALQNQEISGMILDSTFILDPDTMFFNLKQKLNMLPKFPSIFMVNLMLPLFGGYNLNHVPSDTVKSTAYKMPLFLIHGEKDNKAPYQTITQFFQTQKANPNSKLWLLPNGHHELIFAVYKKEYLQKTMQFLADCVNAKSRKIIVDI